MKIAYCLEVPIPIRCAECVVGMKNSDGLAQNGHEVTLIYPNIPEPREETTDIFSFYGVKSRFNLKQVDWWPIPGRRLLAGYFAAKFAKKENVDLVYSRSVQAALMSAFLGIPTIFEYHTPIRDSSRLGDFLFKKLIKNKNMKRLVVITQSLKEYYSQNYGIDKSMIVVAPDAADEALPTEKISFSQKGKLQVGYIGSLYPGKGVEIISALAVQIPWAEFHLIGGVEQDLKYWNGKTASISNFHLHGFVPYAKTDQYRQSFDVLIAPYLRTVLGYDRGSNLSDWMSPLKLFEYMSAGKVIITSDLPVIREVMHHEEDALLCNPDHIDEWITALETVRDNPELKQKLETNALKEFHEKYTWKKRGFRVLDGAL